MRFIEKRSLLEIIETVREMLEYIITLEDMAEVKLYIEQCKESIQTVQEYIKNAVPEFNDIKLTETYNCYDSLIGSISLDNLKESIDQAIHFTHESIESIDKEISARKIALFLPYKASMWTSLESIWMEADKDSECDAIVMPIPYYELDNEGKRKNLCFEGDEFPPYVPIVHYDSYSIEENQPDIIFIHNPYDEYNRVTRVTEQFYSSYLKKHTDCLVFSPYFTYGTQMEDEEHWFSLSGMFNADKIIAQSKRVKSLLVDKYDYEATKILDVGSPKIDAIVTQGKKNIEMPKAWKEKLSGKKKIFLLNTHMMYFAATLDSSRTNGTEDVGIKFHKEIIDIFTREKECGLIWRPHPLMKAIMNRNSMIGDQYEESLQFIEYLEETLEAQENCVIDRSGDYRTAFQYSDASITTYSSLLQEYMITGKPSLILAGNPTQEMKKKRIIDFSYDYFALKTDNMSIEAFKDMVLKGEDPRKAKRMKVVEKAFSNVKGTAGKEAYWQICKEL